MFDALDCDDGLVESERDWNDKRRDPYLIQQFCMTRMKIKKQAEMDDDDTEVYKEMSGIEETREQGKVKTSKYVKSYHELYGEEADELFQLSEDVMSNLHQLTDKVKDEAEFVKQFFKEYGDKVKKTADSPYSS